MNYLSKSSLFSFTALIIFVAAACLNASAGTEIVYLSKNLGPSNLYILTIGINEYQSSKIDNYQSSGIPNLTAADNDAIVLADELEKRGRDKFDSVHKTVLLDGKAKKTDILNEFDRLSREIKSNDVFVFSFSGMGMDALSVEADEFYLFPSDFVPKSFNETGISNTQLQTLFRKIRAGSKLVILDSCKSASGYESAINSFVEKDRRVAALNDENVLFIGTDTVSIDNSETNHGSLTEIILKGLKGDADFSGDGIVSARELEAFSYKGAISVSLPTGGEFHPRTVTRGENFDVGFSDKGIEKIAQEKAKKKNEAPGTNQETAATRSTPVELENDPAAKVSEWHGKSYALLFANDTFDSPGWRKLKNPQNDARDVAKELTDRYGFAEVVTKTNLTAAEIYDTIEKYQDKGFRNFNADEDQLFILFSGHGIADKYNKGFYVGKDSPSPLTRDNENKYVSLDGVLNAIDRIPLEHLMVVFDACYAGQAWQPSIQLVQENAQLEDKPDFSLAKLISPFPSNDVPLNLSDSANSAGLFDFSQLSRLAYAKRKIKERARRVMTSGDKPVPDGYRKADGSWSDNSPFADAFLQALKTGGGSFGVLTTTEIIPFVDKLSNEPQIGKISGSSGDFVFVKADK